jgi:hypothetical protein
MHNANCPVKVSTMPDSGLNDAATAILSRTRAAWLGRGHDPSSVIVRRAAVTRKSAGMGTTSYLKLLSLEL